eukprot:scaffold798_cov367-Pavlova_lutheri.AAC.3
MERAGAGGCSLREGTILTIVLAALPSGCLCVQLLLRGPVHRVDGVPSDVTHDILLFTVCVWGRSSTDQLLEHQMPDHRVDAIGLRLRTGSGGHFLD